MNHAPVIQIMRDFYRNAADVEPVGTDKGIDPVATYSDVELMIPGLLERIVKAEKEGCRAAIVGCFGDPALAALVNETSSSCEFRQSCSAHWKPSRPASFSDPMMTYQRSGSSADGSVISVNCD